jgi:sarcosine oxidase, subunit gamma
MPSLEPPQITLATNRAMVHLKSWATEPGLPILVPARPGDDLRVLNLGPSEWLVVSDVLSSPRLKESLDRHLKDDSFAATDVSNGLKTLRIEGATARELLVRGCGVDLRPERFPAGRCTRTRFAQLLVVIHCLDPKSRFDLYVGRSYLAYLKSWLLDTTLGFPP